MGAEQLAPYTRDSFLPIPLTLVGTRVLSNTSVLSNDGGGLNDLTLDHHTKVFCTCTSIPKPRSLRRTLVRKLPRGAVFPGQPCGEDSQGNLREVYYQGLWWN